MDTKQTLKNKIDEAQSTQQQLLSAVMFEVCCLYNEDNDPETASSLYTEIQFKLDLLHKREAAINSTIDFVERIKAMNLAFQPITCYNTQLTNLGQMRLHQFHAILSKELDELWQASSTGHLMTDQSVTIDYTALADCLGDLVVFIFSEAARWGIPLLEVLSIIMDSQASKLVDGKPLPHPTEPGKFGKGPNYFPPEDRIRQLLLSYKGPNS